MNQKKLGASSKAPTQAETFNHNRRDGSYCQAWLRVEIDRKTRSSLERGTKKGHSYRPLKAQFRKDGFDCRLITREGDFAIYEQKWQDSENVCYEVVHIQRHEGYEIAGNFLSQCPYRSK